MINSLTINGMRALMIRSVSVVLILFLVFANYACSSIEEDLNLGPISTPSPDLLLNSESGNSENGEIAASGSADTDEPVMLERGEDGILIGSMVFREPMMLVGIFRDGETVENVINIRTEPTIDSQIVDQINFT